MCNLWYYQYILSYSMCVVCLLYIDFHSDYTYRSRNLLISLFFFLFSVNSMWVKYCNLFTVFFTNSVNVMLFWSASEVYYWCVNTINCTGKNVSEKLLLARGEADSNKYLCSKDLRPSKIKSLSVLELLSSFIGWVV